MSPADNIAYDYDANGNRTQLSANSGTSYYDYTPETNRLSLIDGLPVTLDSAGNTLDDGTLQYDYTPAGRLSSARPKPPITAASTTTTTKTVTSSLKPGMTANQYAPTSGWMSGL